MHVLILGITFSGKSNLAKRLAANMVAKGEQVIIYDPVKTINWPDSAIKFSDPETFLKQIDFYQNAHVFLDEAKTLFDYDMEKATNLLSQKRHNGMLMYVIAQRANMIPPNARNMCVHVYSFKQNGTNCKILAEEYNESFLEVRTLPENVFIYSNGFKAGKFRLDYSGCNPPGQKGPPPVFAG